MKQFSANNYHFARKRTQTESLAKEAYTEDAIGVDDNSEGEPTHSDESATAATQSDIEAKKTPRLKDRKLIYCLKKHLTQLIIAIWPLKFN